jgi:DNA-binding response OmpR family regulator
MKILLADNDADFLDTRAEFLSNAGYQVLKAGTLEEAQRILAEEYIHLAILDIRLVDDDDGKDVSGLMLAQDPAYQHITKIVFTNFPNFEDTRASMKPSKSGPAPAVNYLAKVEGPGAMIREVREALKEHVRINPDLRIRWQQREGVYSFAQLVGIIAPETENGKLAKRVNELEDLFRRLFCTYEQITLSRILWQKHSQVALGIYAYAHNHEEQFVVVCGERQVIQTSLDNITEYALNLGQTQVQFTEKTMHFAAMALSLNGVELETLQNFATFYRENTGQTAKRCLDVLVQTTLSPWMQRTQWIDSQVHIVEHFRERWGLAESVYPPSTFDNALQTLAQRALLHNIVELTVTPEQLIFSFPGGQRATYPNPGKLLYLDGSIPFSWKGVCETAAGDLDVQTILVEPSGQTWITDLRHTPVMPAGYNLAQFETNLRFSLIPTDNFQTLWNFETQLLDATLHGQTLRVGDVEPPYHKALTLIQGLRQAAKHVANDSVAYQINLFLGALAYFVTYHSDWAYTRAEIAHFLHTILFAAMIYDSLDKLDPGDLSASQSQRCPQLRVDAQNREVWVGNHQVMVSQTEFDLLLYLYQRAGQLCRREDIVKDVFRLPDSSAGDQASLINTNIGRLRKKVEFDTCSPRYIETVWGQGYKLIVQPE